ncbi:MAG TPA: tetraacyldisaccharide 4'-kinase [Terriglobales bacterium]|nr:tetraacyldisaccharide 4'-kinase [Terriglobales bacterium]
MATLASHIFGQLVKARERGYASGRLGVARLGAPVISVGNLNVGGSGKTPTVIALGQALQQRGLSFDVLTRGYGRRRRGLAIAQTGEEDVAEVGDEPKLMALALRAPVMIHADRFRAGMESEHRFHPRLHLLDDGFQHRQLGRNFDLVLVTPGDLEDRLLPAGRLREPLSALARASAVLWMGEGDLPETARRFVTAPVFSGRKRALPVSCTAHRPFAFCGLGRPESFWRTLEESGITPSGRLAFRDHHRYRARDIARLRKLAAAASADGFITTAKDMVNLAGAGLEAPTVVSITMEVPAMEQLLDLILAACRL